MWLRTRHPSHTAQGYGGSTLHTLSQGGPHPGSVQGFLLQLLFRPTIVQAQNDTLACQPTHACLFSATHPARPSAPGCLQYAEDIVKITNAAVKEVTIENELKKLYDVWREQRFELGKYIKGTEDRGWVLRQTEEILLLLEDMGLNLGSMMASPFVRPFLSEVRSSCATRQLPL